MTIMYSSDSSDFSDQSDEEVNSDIELQRAFAEGKLRTGLNKLVGNKKKLHTNDVAGLKKKLSQFEVSLPWLEKMDLINKPAEVGPEMADEIEEHGKIREKRMTVNQKNPTFSLNEDPLHNDFVREMQFYRQAQAAVLEGIPKLKQLGIVTRRPDDYFAQMSKSDEHMQKVRNRLLKKQAGLAMSERVKKIRELKKFGKKVQIEVQQQRQKEKKDLLDKVTKFRKHKTDSIDFLNETRIGDSAKTKNQLKKELRNAKLKRKIKDDKFGFGGRKKGQKRNTAEDAAQMGRSSFKKKPGSKYFGSKGGKGKTGAKRPGKSKRQHTKN